VPTVRHSWRRTQNDQRDDAYRWHRRHTVKVHSDFFVVALRYITSRCRVPVGVIASTARRPSARPRCSIAERFESARQLPFSARWITNQHLAGCSRSSSSSHTTAVVDKSSLGFDALITHESRRSFRGQHVAVHPRAVYI